MLLNPIAKNTLTYISAFVITLLVLVYIVRLPYLLTGANDLVNEYYVQHGAVNIPLDFLLCSLYFLVAYVVFWSVGVRSHEVAQRTVLIALVTIGISGFFLWYLTTKPPSSSFFSRWFHRVGWSGVLYDVLLLTVLYLVYRRMSITLNVKPIL